MRNSIFRKLLPKKENIVSFQAFYATVNDLNQEQHKSYQFIVEKIEKGTKVEVGKNISYLFAILFEYSKKLLNEKDYTKIIEAIKNLQSLYADISNLYDYCNWTIADIYFCFGEFDKFIEIRSPYLTGVSINTYLANNILYIKSKLNQDFSAKELLGINNKLTKFGKIHINEVLKIMDSLIREEERYKNMVDLAILEQTEKHEKYRFSLFSGNPYGFELNEILLKDENWNFCIALYNNRKFIDAIEELSRKSENKLRESMGIPNINEGWVSEAKLYYGLKNEFKNYNVIHQYKPVWLGRQSLDIFIEELNLAIEYQGLQHYQPVKYFGGEEGFLKTLRRDKRKARLCKRNNITLIYVKEGYELPEILEKIRSFEKP